MSSNITFWIDGAKTAKLRGCGPEWLFSVSKFDDATMRQYVEQRGGDIRADGSVTFGPQLYPAMRFSSVQDAARWIADERTEQEARGSVGY